MLRWFKRRAERRAQLEREANAFATQLAVAAEQRRERQADWLAALPRDLQADLVTLSEYDLEELIATAALTPPADCADAVRRWRTLPDNAPKRPADMPLATFVDQLFTTQLRPDGTCYTEQNVAAAFEGQVDPDAVKRLRAGLDEPLDLELLFAIGRFFHVPPDYFLSGGFLCVRGSHALSAQRRLFAENLLRMVGSAAFQPPRNPDRRNETTL